MTCTVKQVFTGWYRRPSGWGLACGFWVLLTVCGWGAELSETSEATLALPGVGLSVIRLLGAFVLVVALALGGVWLLRNWARLAPRSGIERTLKVLEVRMLGGRQSLVVVGYEDQRMLLAASPTGVAFLCRLPSVQPGEPPAGDTELAPTFLEALSTAVGQRG